MYRSVLALLFASVLLLGGCAAGQQTVPKEKSGAVKKRDEYHIRNESRISNMQKGL